MTLVHLKELLFASRENDLFDAIKQLPQYKKSSSLQTEFSSLYDSWNSVDNNFNPEKWKKRMLEFIKKMYTGDELDSRFWLNLDRYNLKKAFRNAARKNSVVFVLFEESEEHLSLESQKFILHDFSEIKKRNFEPKGNVNNWKIDLAQNEGDIENDWLDFVEYCFTLGASSVGEVSKLFNEKALNRNEYFFVMGMQNFSLTKFNYYMGLWQTLSEDSKFYFMIHVLDDSLQTNEHELNKLASHCLAITIKQYDLVCSRDFKTFYALEECPYNQQDKLVHLTECISLKKAKEYLENGIEK